MTTNNQKKEELAQLTKAFRLLRITSYEVIDAENESPDLLVKIDGNLIGVEVSEIPRGNARKTESDLRIIVEEAIKIYNSKKGVSCSFAFGFNGNIAMNNRGNVSRVLGQFLVEQSDQFSSAKLYEVTQVIPDKSKYPELDIVNQIYARRNDEENSAGFITSIFDSEEIQKQPIDSLIKNKERFLTKYRERSKVVWLLIVLPSMRKAADFILPETELFTDCKGFDSIYLLDDYRDQIQCINQSKNL